MLRFVPVGAVERVHGGRPTSRGLPPAVFWGKLLPFPKKGFSRVWTLERVRAEPAVPPAGWLRGFGGLMERRRVCFRSSGAPARTFLMGKPFLHPTLPRDKPKSGAPTLKRFCPAGANSVDPAHRQHILAPRGKDASFSPLFPSTLEADANARLLAGACFPHRPAAANDKKKGGSLFLPEKKKILKRSCPLHPLQLQPQRSAPARMRTSSARAAHIPVGKRPPSGGQRIAPAGRGCCSSTRTPALDDTSKKRAQAEIEKLCRENAAIRRTKPRRAMPSAAGNAVRPCRSRRFFRAGASYSLAAVL